MAPIVGAFDDTGSAILRIRVSGAASSSEYTAVIDTGFTGFLAMPVNEMIELGLRSEGAATVILGDGSAIDNLVATGSVTLGGRTEAGRILLDETSRDVLVGMNLLRAFKLALVISGAVVVLHDERETFELISPLMKNPFESK